MLEAEVITLDSGGAGCRQRSAAVGTPASKDLTGLLCAQAAVGEHAGARRRCAGLARPRPEDRRYIVYAADPDAPASTAGGSRMLGLDKAQHRQSHASSSEHECVAIDDFDACVRQHCTAAACYPLLQQCFA